jgi:hypothetical protein
MIHVKGCLMESYNVCNIYAMKRTTIFAEESLLRQLRAEARRQGVSTAKLVREALAAYVARHGSTTGIPSIAGQYASGNSDTSARVDELLWREPHS